MELSFEKLPEAVAKIYIKLESVEKLLLSKNDRKVESEDEFLTVSEAAQFLDLSVPTIYGLVHKSHLPVSKKGKRLYFSKMELTNWIKTGRRKTISEIGAEAGNYLNKKGRG